AVPAGGQRGVAGGRDDPLVGGEQVVGVGVEIGDAADQGRGCDEVVAVGQQLRHQPDVAGVALNEPVARMVVVGLHDPAVLGQVIYPGHRVPAPQQFPDEISADKARRSADSRGPNANRYQRKYPGIQWAISKLETPACRSSQMVGISATGRPSRRALAMSSMPISK